MNITNEVTGTITKDYIYDSKNKLSQITEKDNGVVTKITTYVYDLNGNLLTTTENGTIVETNVFNDRNELISTTKNNTTTTYNYNVEGKRISKSDGTNLTKFIYEGTNIILEVDGINNELSRNIYGLALVLRATASDNGYYLYNGHGDVVNIIDELNQILNTYVYDAFGNITDETETLDNPYKYAGYYYDNETGNYYLMSRYYNPVIARFISEDTYRGELNDPLSLNRYVYVNNNPMIYYDPDGYFFKEIWEGIKFVSVRAAALVHGAGELAVESVVGLGKMAWTTGEFVGSSIGLSGNEIVHQLGLTSDDTYKNLQNAYGEKFLSSGQTLASLPGNMINGVINNFQTTFNTDNLNAYLNPEASYDTLKNYSKSVVQTGLTIYGGYELGKAVYNGASNLIHNYQTNKIMNSVNISNINVNKISQMGSNFAISRNGLSTLNANITWRNVAPEWPINDGFDGEPIKITLKQGTQIDRYGNEQGTFVSPKGTSFNERSLPFGAENRPYNSYEVVKPINNVKSGRTAPFYGQPGGGVQYKLPMTVEELKMGGFIK